jgi:hypothetical protein
MENFIPIAGATITDFFIRDKPGVGGHKEILKKVGYSYMGSKKYELPFGTTVADEFHVADVQDCICKDFGDNPGKCNTCDGTGDDVFGKCKYCKGSGICSKCSGKGEVSFEEKVWYDKDTGIFLRREKKIKGEMVLIEYLEQIKPRNILGGREELVRPKHDLNYQCPICLYTTDYYSVACPKCHKGNLEEAS